MVTRLPFFAGVGAEYPLVQVYQERQPRVKSTFLTREQPVRLLLHSPRFLLPSSSRRLLFVQPLPYLLLVSLVVERQQPGQHLLAGGFADGVPQPLAGL